MCFLQFVYLTICVPTGDLCAETYHLCKNVQSQKAFV